MEFLWGSLLKSHLIAYARWPVTTFTSLRLPDHQKISASGDIVILDAQMDDFPFIYDAGVQHKYLSTFAVWLLR